MRDIDLYTRILGIQAPWRVADVEVDMPQGQVIVHVERKAGAQPCCPTCSKPAPGYDSRRRRWSHLDTCPAHGETDPSRTQGRPVATPSDFAGQVRIFHETAFEDSLPIVLYRQRTQVAPATTARVVTWRRLATGRATWLCTRFPFHVDDDLPLGHINLHIGDSTRCLNTQYPGV